MPPADAVQSGLHLLGIRRRRGDPRSREDTSTETPLSNVLKKSRQLPEDGIDGDVELQNATTITNRLLNIASESRRDLLNAFYTFLTECVPGFKFETIGIVDHAAVDYLCTHLSDRICDVLGDGGLLVFRASQMESTDNAVLFRGVIDGITFDVLVNRIKFKPLLRFLVGSSQSICEARQTLVLLNPRVLGQRLVVPSALVIARD